MSTGVVPAHNVGQDSTPNHMIIWLDKHIGLIEQCVLLKKNFIRAMNPENRLFERTIGAAELARIVQDETPPLVEFNGVQFMFQPCVDVEKCFEIIEKNLRKRIFLITSGSKGKFLLPIIKAYLSEKFQPGYTIYIFCGKMNMIPTECEGQPTNDWAMNYEENLVMYNHQNHLLTRLVLDIAMHFAIEGERFERLSQLADAHQHYYWSRTMWERYDILAKRNPMKGKIEEMTQAMIRTERGPSMRHAENEEEPIGESAD